MFNVKIMYDESNTNEIKKKCAQGTQHTHTDTHTITQNRKKPEKAKTTMSLTGTCYYSLAALCTLNKCVQRKISGKDFGLNASTTKHIHIKAILSIDFSSLTQFKIKEK